MLNISALHRRPITRIIGAGIVVLCLSFVFVEQTRRAQSDGLTQTPSPTADSKVTPDSAAPTTESATSIPTVQHDSCQAILSKAYQSIQTVCGTLDRNKACYGNDNVKAELISAENGSFSTPGDILPIKVIKSIAASPLDVQNQTWGLSLLKLQANLPDTLPGQNVTFLVYGGTSIQNTSGDMRMFYFSSTLGSSNCQELPTDGIVVSSPNHTQVTFSANGVQITIASTIVLHAQPNLAMNVSLVEGHAQVKTSAGTQTLLPGQMVSVRMGGANGLQAIGAPTTPATAPLDLTTVDVLRAAKKAQDPQATSLISIDGCISHISGNTVTIGGYTIAFDPGTPQSKSLRVGSCIHVDGDFQLDNHGKLVIVPGKPAPDNGDPGNGNSDGQNSKGRGHKDKGDGKNPQSNGTSSDNNGGNGNSDHQH